MSINRDKGHIGKVPFSVSARVAIQLGRESISNSIVAILELVKNAYDADATEVTLTFSDLGTADAKLIIEDNGTGMTIEQLRDHWMVLGTTDKLNRGHSAGGRVLVGEKGLGRLGLDRLSRLTVLQTFVEHDERGLELRIDWSKYQNISDRLEQVEHDLFWVSKQEAQVSGKSLEYGHGVRLELSELRDPWKTEDLEHLRRDLSLLVSPFAGVNDFKIILQGTDPAAQVDGEVTSDDILDAAEWRVESLLDEDKSILFEMTSPVYSENYSYSANWAEAFANNPPSPTCGPLKMIFYFLPRRSTQPLGLKKAQVDQFMDRNQGIRIYRDGFRVRPYGDPDGVGDWLTLSYRRQISPGGVSQGGWRVGYNQLVGAVFVSRHTNPNLIDQTNREGIVEGSAFDDLRTFALKAVRFFELNRQEFETSRKKPSSLDESATRAREGARASSVAVEKLKQTVSEVAHGLGASNAVSPALRDAFSQVNAGVKVLDEQLDSWKSAQENLVRTSRQSNRALLMQKNTLSNLASLGILAAAFGHETLAAANLALANVELLRDHLKELLLVPPEVRETMVRLEDSLQRIHTFAQFTLGNVVRDKRTRKSIRINEIIDHVLDSFRDLFEERGVSLIRDYGEEVPNVRAFPIDWESITVNMVTNALWALSDTRRDARRFRVRIRSDRNMLSIQFADSGRGLEAGSENRVFLPTFSTKRNRKGDVIGTGMGLAIVKDLVDLYGGSVLATSSDLGGAAFEITIPLSRIAEIKGKDE